MWNLLRTWWQNRRDDRAGAPTSKARARSTMSVDIPQGGHLQVVRVHHRWGVAGIPGIGRVKFRWTRGLPVGRNAATDNRITGARRVKDAWGRHTTFRVQPLEPLPQPHRA